jgi:hypothetical protein
MKAVSAPGGRENDVFCMDADHATDEPMVRSRARSAMLKLIRRDSRW